MKHDLNFSVDSAACTASYGASANLVSGGGSGMVGWVQQFSEYMLQR